MVKGVEFMSKRRLLSITAFVIASSCSFVAVLSLLLGVKSYVLSGNGMHAVFRLCPAGVTGPVCTDFGWPVLLAVFAISALLAAILIFVGMKL